MRIVWKLWALVVVVSIVAAGGAEADSRWEQLPKAPGRAIYISGIGLDEHDGLWMMAGTGLYYWMGREFKRPEGAFLKAGQYLTGLYGGRHGGLFATQRGSEKHEGAVYRLLDGHAEYLTDFYYGITAEYPGFYVSRSGLVLNWGDGKLGLYRDNSWDLVEFKAVQHDRVPVFDTGESVYMLYDDKLVGVDSGGEFSELEVFAHGGNGYRGIVWDRQSILFYKYGGREIVGFSFSTGKQINVDRLNEQLGDCRIYGGFRIGAGVVWLLMEKKGVDGRMPVSVTKDGVRVIPCSEDSRWNKALFSDEPKCVLTDRDGTIWLGFDDQRGVVRYKDDSFIPFVHYEDNSPSRCRALLQDSKGRMYGASDRRVYIYHDGEPIFEDSQPVFPRVVQDLRTVWRHNVGRGERIKSAWCFGKTVSFLIAGGNEIVSLDIGSGMVRSRISLPEDSHSVWLSQIPDSENVMVNAEGRLLKADPFTGQVFKINAPKSDPRLCPVAAGRDYCYGGGYRSEVMMRVNPAGEKVWACSLPGYIHTHPARFGSVLIVQTRGSSYGGQATSGVDVESGKLLWSDTTNAYGHGVVIADDAQYMVEANTWLSPGATAGLLIARNPFTGAKLWEYRREQTIMDQAPVIVGEANRIFAVFQDGAIVCLDEKSGRVIWETSMQDDCFEAPAASYDPYWPAINYHGRFITVIDRNSIIYFLNVSDGRIMLRVSVGGGRIVAQPWMDGKELMVITERCIRVCSLGGVLE